MKHLVKLLKSCQNMVISVGRACLLKMRNAFETSHASIQQTKTAPLLIGSFLFVLIICRWFWVRYSNLSLYLMFFLDIMAIMTARPWRTTLGPRKLKFYRTWVCLDEVRRKICLGSVDFACFRRSDSRVRYLCTKGGGNPWPNRREFFLALLDTQLLFALDIVWPSHIQAKLIKL